MLWWGDHGDEPATRFILKIIWCLFIDDAGPPFNFYVSYTISEYKHVVSIRENSLPLISISAWWRHQMENCPRYWPFVRGIHRSPVNSPHKGQWRGALMFSLIYAWTNDWVRNRKAGDLRRHWAHYDVTVMRRSQSVEKYRGSVFIAAFLVFNFVLLRRFLISNFYVSIILNSKSQHSEQEYWMKDFINNIKDTLNSYLILYQRNVVLINTLHFVFNALLMLRW